MSGGGGPGDSKGGKPLAMMQQRRMQMQQTSPHQAEPGQAPPAPPAQAPANADVVDATPAASPQGGKPKGKNFAAMAQRRSSPPPTTTSVPPGAGTAPDPGYAAGDIQQQYKPTGLSPQQHNTTTNPLYQGTSTTLKAGPVAGHSGQRPTATSVTAGQRTAMPTMAEAKLRRSSASSAASSKSQTKISSSFSRGGSSPPSPSIGPHHAPLVGQKLQSLLESIDPNYVLDAEAEEQLLRLADDFVDSVVRRGMRLAKHRGSDRLEVPDLALVLKKGWGITVPGLGGGAAGGQAPPSGGGSAAAARAITAGSASPPESKSLGLGSGAKRNDAPSSADGEGRKSAKRPATASTKAVSAR